MRMLLYIIMMCICKYLSSSLIDTYTHTRSKTYMHTLQCIQDQVSILLVV
jgi:hypothetical protein